MRLTVLRETEYKNHPVWIHIVEDAFQFFFEYEGRLYQEHFYLKKNFLLNLLWRLGVEDCPYNDEQIQEAEEILLSGVVASIDNLIANPPKKRVAVFRERSGMMKSDKCTWLTKLDAEKKPYWYCLDHKKSEPFIDGEKPKHKEI